MLIRAGQPRPRTVEELLSPALIARLDRLDVRSRKVFAGKLVGERRSKQRGRSVEFADHREYVPGDDIRFIDWNVFGRMDRLFIKMFLEEQDMSVHVALDASPSMDAGSPSKLLFAQRLAMALGYVALVNHNRLAVTVFGQSVPERLPEVRGRRNVQRLARFLLDRVRPTEAAPSSAGAPGSGASFTEAMRSIALTRRGKGVMIVLSDFLLHEGYEAGLRMLAAGGGAGDAFDTYCLQVLAPGEIDPAAEAAGGQAGVAGDVRLTDVETGRAAEVTVSAALLKRYRQRLEEHLAGLSAFCLARRMTHVLLRSDADVERVALDTLQRRGLLG